MEKKFHFGVFEILLLIGIALTLYSSVSLWSNVKKTSELPSVEATVARVDDGDDGEETRTYLKYTLDGENYTAILHITSVFMREGDRVTLYYQPDDYRDVTCFWMYGSTDAFLLTIGAALILTYGVRFVVLRLRREHERFLKHSGTRVSAEIVGVESNPTVAVNGFNPLVIVCRGEDFFTGESVYYKSRNLWYDPQPILDYLKIDRLDVYQNREKATDYFLDLSPVEAGRKRLIKYYPHGFPEDFSPNPNDE